jgi:hypothetical protein
MNINQSKIQECALNKCPCKRCKYHKVHYHDTIDCRWLEYNHTSQHQLGELNLPRDMGQIHTILIISPRHIYGMPHFNNLHIELPIQWGIHCETCYLSSPTTSLTSMVLFLPIGLGSLLKY